MNIHHVALLTQHPQRLAEFYERVLGLSRVPVPHERSVWLGLGDAILMIERTEEPPHVRQSGWHLLALQISVVERAKLRERCISLGVAIESETDFSFYVRDPDGNRVGLSHYPQKATTLST